MDLFYSKQWSYKELLTLARRGWFDEILRLKNCNRFARQFHVVGESLSIGNFGFVKELLSSLAKHSKPVEIPLSFYHYYIVRKHDFHVENVEWVTSGINDNDWQFLSRFSYEKLLEMIVCIDKDNSSHSSTYAKNDFFYRVFRMVDERQERRKFYNAFITTVLDPVVGLQFLYCYDSISTTFQIGVQYYKYTQDQIQDLLLEYIGFRNAFIYDHHPLDYDKYYAVYQPTEDYTVTFHLSASDEAYERLIAQHGFALKILLIIDTLKAPELFYHLAQRTDYEIILYNHTYSEYDRRKNEIFDLNRMPVLMTLNDDYFTPTQQDQVISHYAKLYRHAIQTFSYSLQIIDYLSHLSNYGRYSEFCKCVWFIYNEYPKNDETDSFLLQIKEIMEFYKQSLNFSFLPILNKHLPPPVQVEFSELHYRENAKRVAERYYGLMLQYNEIEQPIGEIMDFKTEKTVRFWKIITQLNDDIKESIACIMTGLCPQPLLLTPAITSLSKYDY